MLQDILRVWQLDKKEAKLQGEELVAQLMALIEDLDQPFRRSELGVSEYLLSVLQFTCKTILRRELSATPSTQQVPWSARLTC